jgi:dephospho-CoA kinase
MKRTVIGVVGPIASGKGFLAEYLKSRGFFMLTLSDRLREEADRLGIARTRENLVAIGNRWRHEFGSEVLAKRSVALIPKEAKQVVIDGIRNPGEIVFLREFWKATIIGVDAAAQLRLDWYLERAKRRGEDTASEEAFWKANNRDLGLGEDTLGQQGKLCLELADIRIVNDGTAKFPERIRTILQEKLGLNPEGNTVGKEKW